MNGSRVIVGNCLVLHEPGCGNSNSKTEKRTCFTCARGEWQQEMKVTHVIVTNARENSCVLQQ